MKYDTFLSGTVSVAAHLDCGIIKKWREWLPFMFHKVIFWIYRSRADWEPALFFVPVEKLSTSGCALQRDEVL